MGKMEKLVQYAIKNVPYYQGKEWTEIQDFPFIDKKIVKNNYNLFLSNQVENRQEILQYLNEEFKIQNYMIEKRVSKDIVMEWTTGSSGVPFKSVKHISERKQIALNMWKYRMRESIVISKYYPLIHTGEAEGLFDIRDYSKENIERMYMYFINNGISCIHATPNLLKRHIEKSNVDLEFFKNKVSIIEVTGHYLSDVDKQYLEDVFNAKIVNMYGLIEVWGIATSSDNYGLKIIDENVFVELIDENANVIEDEYVVGEIVVTALNQFIMPFIRYRTGDKAMYANGKRLVLQKDRTINQILINGEKMSGSDFARQVIRKIYWVKDFQDIQFFSVMKMNETLYFLLNEIDEKAAFENVAKKVVFSLTNLYLLEIKYLSERQYERINPKNYIFFEKEGVLNEKNVFDETYNN